ncbi:MAG: TraR/DksA C4-type zinc finger protein [Actinomycetota bacterium]|nr:TraR/DksA C4-type zinc finger protein [Actinomycetota bacterium]
MANDARTVDYRALLLEERASLESQLAELGYGEVGRLNYDSNFADTSQVTAERGETEALARELSDALADVERALGKLQDGQYGSCERCGKEIAPARLEAMPAVKTCIACASAQR